MQFTGEQLSIIKHRAGHARVSAVAGSGKTTTMIGRVGHLLERGVAPDDILILMFNRSARDCFAGSMQDRLGPGYGRLPEVRTFHALGNRLVDSFVRRGGLPPSRLVTDEYYPERLARQVAMQAYRSQEEGDVYLPVEEVEEFLTFIDLVKAGVHSAAEVFTEQGLSPKYSYFIEAFDLFEKVRKSQGLRFFSDLIYDPLMAMLQDRVLQDWVSNRVSHIIVDEYQDINETQQRLLRILAGNRAEVMVVGDVDQCIYEWRGARPEYITDRFRLDFKNPKTYLLSYTFRYGHALSLLANHVIANNRQRDKKLCISHPSVPYTAVSCQAKGRATDDVVRCLREWQNSGRSLSEAAVLVRLYAQSVAVELALLQADIPYRMLGNAQVFECPEVLALSGYLRLAHGSLGTMEAGARQQTVRAMLSQPHPGLKRKLMAKLVQQICEAPGDAVRILERWFDAELPGFIKSRIVEARDNWHYFSLQAADMPAGRFLRMVVDRLQLFDFYHKFSARTATAENRIKTCEVFIDYALGQGFTVTGLLEEMARLCVVDRQVTSDTLLITSIHRAKGLEWPLVILPGLEDGFLPLCREEDRSVAESMEDERRLFYVAVTRAKEQLVCMHPVDNRLTESIRKNRKSVPGQRGRASRFLYEANIGLSISLGGIIEGKTERRLIRAEDIVLANRYLAAIEQDIELAQSAPAEERNGGDGGSLLTVADLQEGMRVLHPVLGSGEVMAVKDKRQGRVEVNFKEHGRMVLIMAHARLRSEPAAG
jgi:DNA helicase-2/ATP-dependent DNA helicase PcrA